MRVIVLAAAVCALAGAARTQSEAPPWAGVWQGTVGAAEVRACFGTRDQPDHGSYYYLRHLKLIPLTPGFADSGQAWTEGPDSSADDAPRWTLTRTAGGVMAGTWSGKGRSLPIHLTRVRYLKAQEAEEPCRGMTFMGPRLTPPTVTRKPAVQDGTGYTELIANVGAHLDVKIESFELAGATPAAARINAELAKPLPRPGGKTPDWLTCLLDAAGSFGEDGEVYDVVEPGLITRRLLVVSETQHAQCGDAHPSDAVDWRLYSLASGESVDPWTWFAADAARRSKDGPTEIGARLRKMLTARWTGEDECKDVAATEDDWDIHPTREGLAFWPQLPHVNYPCSYEVVIPYRELAPLLNANGRAAIAEIVEDLRSLPPETKAKS